MHPTLRNLTALGLAALLAGPAAAQTTRTVTTTAQPLTNPAVTVRVFGGLGVGLPAGATLGTVPATPAPTGYSSGGPGVLPNAMGNTSQTAPGARLPDLFSPVTPPGTGYSSGSPGVVPNAGRGFINAPGSPLRSATMARTNIVPGSAIPPALTPATVTPTVATPTAVTPGAVTPTVVTPTVITPTLPNPVLVTPQTLTPTTVGGTVGLQSALNTIQSSQVFGGLNLALPGTTIPALGVGTAPIPATGFGGYSSGSPGVMPNAGQGTVTPPGSPLPTITPGSGRR
jgi:hypothetical protein